MKTKHVLLLTIIIVCTCCVSKSVVKQEEQIKESFNAYGNYYLNIPQEHNLAIVKQNDLTPIEETNFYSERLRDIASHNGPYINYYMHRLLLSSTFETSIVLQIDEDGALDEYQGWVSFASHQDTTYMITCVFLDKYITADNMHRRYNGLSFAIDNKMNKHYTEGREGRVWTYGQYRIELCYKQHILGYAYEYEYIIRYIDTRLERKAIEVAEAKAQARKAKEQATRDSLYQIEQNELRERMNANHHL